MKGRIQRGSPPRKVLTDANYRKYALPALVRDFDDRCAYSMQHRRRAGGSILLMEIDHFDPTLTGRNRHRYENLFLASRYCNNRKRKNWPSREHRDRGIRFLNCCKEIDYGEHIFEDPASNRLFGVSPAGKYHITMLDLNAPHLVEERKDRSELRRLLFEECKVVKKSEAAIQLFHVLERELGYMIPPIPAHS